MKKKKVTLRPNRRKRSTSRSKSKLRPQRQTRSKSRGGRGTRLVNKQKRTPQRKSSTRTRSRQVSNGRSLKRRKPSNQRSLKRKVSSKRRSGGRSRQSKSTKRPRRAPNKRGKSRSSVGRSRKSSNKPQRKPKYEPGATIRYSLIDQENVHEGEKTGQTVVKSLTRAESTPSVTRPVDRLVIEGHSPSGGHSKDYSDQEGDDFHIARTSVETRRVSVSNSQQKPGGESHPEDEDKKDRELRQSQGGGSRHSLLSGILPASWGL